MAVVLCYHKIGAGGRRLNVAAEDFERQVRWFGRRGWCAMTFAEVVRDRGARTVAFTFDDAYACTLDSAPWILNAVDFVGTFFVVPSVVGDSSRWDGDDAAPLADWSVLKHAHTNGHAIENHSLTHPRLGRLQLTDVRREIEAAANEIESRIGPRPTTFCYPYGDYSRTTMAALEEGGYEAACTVTTGLMNANTPKFEVPRLKIGYSDRIAGLMYKLYLRPRIERLAHRPSRTRD